MRWLSLRPSGAPASHCGLQALLGRFLDVGVGDRARLRSENSSLSGPPLGRGHLVPTGQPRSAADSSSAGHRAWLRGEELTSSLPGGTRRTARRITLGRARSHPASKPGSAVPVGVPSACHTGRALAAPGGHSRSLGSRRPAPLLYRNGTTRMVRMGSPVRFRRGAPHRL
jgi:hypothetical protein